MDQQSTQKLIDTERLAAQILSSFQKELQKQIEESSTQLRLDIQEQIRKSSVQLRSNVQKDFQNEIEESSTQLRLDIQNVQKDFRKEIEESSTQLRLDIQEQIRKSSVQLRSNVQKDFRNEMAESLSLLRTRIRSDIWERIAEADLSFMWAIFDADTPPGKQLKEVKSRMVSVEEGINRLEARMMEAASS
jgi:SMC interacting uncharacterized protein involved in chromosome segregation